MVTRSPHNVQEELSSRDEQHHRQDDGDVGLHLDRGESVPDDVMQLAGYPDAFLGDHLPFERLPGPLLLVPPSGVASATTCARSADRSGASKARSTKL